MNTPENQPISGSKILANTFYILGIIGLISVFCWFAKAVITTVVIAFMVSMILDPPTVWLERLRFPRWLSIITVILITLIILFTLSTVLFIRTKEFANDMPKFKTKIERISLDIQKRIKVIEKATEQIIPQTGPQEQTVREVKIQESSKWMESVSYIAGILTHAILIPFMVFFILLAGDDLKDKIANLFGEANRISTLQALSQMQSQMIGFLAGNLVSVLILWFVTSLGFLLVGVDYAIVNAGIFAFCNIIPVIGTVVGLLPPVLLVFLETESLFGVAWVAGFGLLMHLIYANVLAPKLVGSRVKLSPIAIIIAMVYWGFIWGATGLILAIPMVACIKTICDHVEPWKPIGQLLE